MFKKYLALCVFVMLGISNVFAGNSGVKDSVGVKKNTDGTMLILHKVEAGETLWALYRKYQKHGTTADGIKKQNGGASTFNVGQTVNIPTAKKYGTTTTTTAQTNPKATGKVYVVKAGETLFTVAQKNNVSVDEIKKWNHLTDNSVNAGQKLIVSGGQSTTTSTPKTTTSSGATTHKVVAGETLFSIAKKYDVSVSDLKKWNPAVEKGLETGAIIAIKKGGGNATHATNVVTNNPAPTTHKDGSVHQEITAVDIHHKKVYTGYEKVVQDGTVALTTRKDFDDKFSYVFHKTIPYGVIVTVVNPKTGEYTYARVIGKLPDSSPNLIEVSKTVWETLKLNGGQGVKISYVL